MRIWALSDIHTDKAENLKWIEGLSPAEQLDRIWLVTLLKGPTILAAAVHVAPGTSCSKFKTPRFRNDTLILAGDVANTFEALKHSVLLLRERFGRVFFCPGSSAASGFAFAKCDCWRSCGRRGNHDLWMQGWRNGDSMDKLHAIIDFCKLHDVVAWLKPPAPGAFCYFARPLNCPQSSAVVSASSLLFSSSHRERAGLKAL